MSSNTWTTMTFKNDIETIKKAVELHEIAVNNVKAKSPSGDLTSMCLFQALPAFYSKIVAENGGNLMGLEQIEEDSILFMAGIHVKEAEMAEYGDAQAKEWLKGVEDFARERGTYVEWQFLNYADKSQNPLASFGAENLAKMKEVAQQYDPEGVFQIQSPGGFKLSNA